MHRIDTPSRAVDLWGAGKHGWRPGNKAIGIEATQASADYFNDVQENIARLIEGAGIPLVKGNHLQLSQAVNAMIVGALQAVTLSGATFEGSVSNGEVVRWDAGNNRFDEAVADGTANNRAIGIADVANGKVYLYGECPLFSGLTPGARYFLDATMPGAVTTVAPTDGVQIGIAKSATVMYIDVDSLSARLDQANAWLAGQRSGFAAFPALTGTVTIDLAQRNNWEANGLTGNVILGNPSTMPVGQSGVLRIVQGATPYTIAYGSYFKATSGALPALTPAAGAVDLLPYLVESATRIWIGAQGDSK